MILRLAIILLPAPMIAACGQSPAEGSASVAVELAAPRPADPASEESGDAKVPGTDYHAIASIPCGDAGKVDSECTAGVKRNAGPDGTTFVELRRPNGGVRILYFLNGKANGADSTDSTDIAGAEQGMTYDFKADREEDWTVIRYGPERYRIPDALVVGG